MTLPVEVNPLMMGGGGYKIGRSLRFRSSATAYLSRTPGSAGNRQIFTWSGWVKRGVLGTQQFLFEAAPSTTARFFICLGNSASDEITVQITDSGAVNGAIVTTQLFRDPSAWYHIVVAIDTTSSTTTLNGSSTDRMRLYINGAQVSAFATKTVPTQNINTACNNTVTHAICSRATTLGSSTIDGYLAEVNFIDGQALTPSSFGENDATTGVWKPKAYTGTYGTNGFYLKFADNSAATAAAIGKDSSGNGNNWTPNNISVTAGVTYDSMIDTPTPYDDGGTGRGNYATLSPLFKSSSAASPANGNLDYTSGNYFVSSTMTGVGKWYWECVWNSGTGVVFGVVDGNVGNPATTYVYNSTSYLSAFYYNTGSKYLNGTSSAYGSSFAAGDIIGVALDMTASPPTVQFYKNNVAQGAITLSATTSAGYFAAVSDSGAGCNASLNFGQRPFTYTPPSGFKALNTQNLPTPTIAAGNKYFDINTYTGTGSTQSLTNSGAMQPDFVWIKRRSAAENHWLTDAVRGSTKGLFSNLTDAEATRTDQLTSFNSNGFSLGADAAGYTNVNGSTYVGWQWKANGSGSSNTSGSITSTVSANVTAGFSVVTWTGTTANATVGHGLGVAPSMIIVKNRGAAENWCVYHTSINATDGLYLNTTAAKTTSSLFWNNTAPTSSVFTVGAWSPVNANTMVAYCFAAVSQYSSFGSYVGTGSADGPFIWTGFRPRFIMFKNASAASTNWIIKDTARSTYNADVPRIFPNLSDTEYTTSGWEIDECANGFKVRATSSELNGSTNTIIYAAFAEVPFKSALAR